MRRGELFARAQSITALEVARREGLRLQQRGARHWARCPLHSGGCERTPSMMFDERGGWYCFSCGAGGGDGVSFAAAIRGIGQAEAARLLLDEPDAPQYRDDGSGERLRVIVETWRDNRLQELDAILQSTAWAVERGNDGRNVGDNDSQWAHLHAFDVRKRLITAKPEELLYHYKLKDTDNYGFTNNCA